jgi:hypothetical protein
MEALLNLLEKSVKLNSSNIWEKVFNEDAIQNFIIVELIQEEQLYTKGIDEDGQPLRNKDNGRTTYSAYTEFLTEGRKKEGEHYTLLDSGDFYKSMIIKVGKNYIEIDADPIKENDNLFEKFGDGIIGLTDESKTKLAQKIAQKYYTNILELLQRDR